LRAAVTPQLNGTVQNFQFQLANMLFGAFNFYKKVVEWLPESEEATKVSIR